MKIDGQKMEQMIDKTYEPGHEMIKAMNQLYGLITENGLYEDPRYREVNHTLTECLIQFQNTSFERGMDLCRKDAIIKTLNKSPLGRYLVNKAIKKLES